MGVPSSIRKGSTLRLFSKRKVDPCGAIHRKRDFSDVNLERGIPRARMVLGRRIPEKMGQDVRNDDCCNEIERYVLCIFEFGDPGLAHPAQPFAILARFAMRYCNSGLKFALGMIPASLSCFSARSLRVRNQIS